MADGSLLFDTKIDTSGVSKGLASVSGIAAKGLGVAAKATAAVGVGISAATGAVAALSKASLDGYAVYEQMVGGVDTLFKDSSKKLQNYAANAYETAGLSANEYMNTVTSFSASLLQSLGGDTDKAADYANQAITDMSDNANKMGTNMQDIQNAYQGFAKQNYTMLDNLKLGYGGTKEEMQRLLEDAEKISGIKYDISSYADVTQAIHVMQEEMGIAGTTAKEASTTIEGSINSTKAAWSNLVTGLGNDDADITELILNFVNSAETAAKNIIPRVELILQGVGSLIDELLPEIMSMIPQIIMDIMPEMVDSGKQLISSIGAGLIEYAPELINYAIEIIKYIVQGIEENLPQIASAAKEIVKVILDGIGDLIPVLQPVTDALEWIIDNFDKVKDAATKVAVVFGTLALAIGAYNVVQAIANLGGAKEAVELGILAIQIGALTAAEWLATAAQTALNFVMNLNPIGIIIGLVVALVAAFIYFWNTSDSFREFWINLWDGITSFFKSCAEGIVTFFTETIPNGFNNLITALSNGWDNIVTFFTEGIPTFIANVITWFQNLPYNIGLMIGEMLGKFIQFGIDMLAWVAVNVPLIIENGLTYLAELPFKVWGWLCGVVDKINAWRLELLVKATLAATTFINGVIDNIKNLPSKFFTWLVNTTAKVIAWRASLIEKGKDAIDGMKDAIVDAAKELPSKMAEIGGHIVGGVWKGICDAKDQFVNNVKSFFSGIVDGVKNELDIHSPSKKFAWIGKMCIEGYEQPFDDWDPYSTIKASMKANSGTISMNMLSNIGTAATGSTTTNSQTINFYDTQTSPDAIARRINKINTYGLAGAR